MVTKKADDAVAAAKKKSDDDGKKGDGVVDDKTKDGAKGKDKTPEVELSEEDAALKENLELMVMRASEWAHGGGGHVSGGRAACRDRRY